MVQEISPQLLTFEEFLETISIYYLIEGEYQVTQFSKGDEVRDRLLFQTCSFGSSKFSNHSSIDLLQKSNFDTQKQYFEPLFWHLCKRSNKEELGGFADSRTNYPM